MRRIDPAVAGAHDEDMNATLPPPQTPTAEPPRESSFPTRREFIRPRDGRRIGGVCAAIADRNGWSRTTVRLVAAFSILLPGPQVFAYLIAWVVMPSEDEVTRPDRPTVSGWSASSTDGAYRSASTSVMSADAGVATPTT